MIELQPREANFEDFLKAIGRTERPSHLPFYEHIASPGFIARRLGISRQEVSWRRPEFPQRYVDFWMGMNYDCVPMEIPLNCALPRPEGEDGAASHSSEATACIRSMEDFEKYDWPDEAEPIAFQYFEQVAPCLPEGAKLVAGVGGGPFEWATKFMGYEGLSLAQVMDPDLFAAIFRKIGDLHVSALRTLARMPFVGALRQGDDLGFKTSTFLSPDTLRQFVIPIYRRMAQTAHEQGKPFILHSCGNLAEVYDDIVDAGVDAKHSFEDVILPVGDFKKRYGERITPIGGADVDFICRAGEDDLRAYTRRLIEDCFYDGHWALGTGNSLTDYMPVESYLVCLDEGMRAA